MAPQAPEPLSPEARAGLVKTKARELGFDTAGVTDLSPVPHAAALDRWLASGMAGTMDYLRRQQQRRREPETILPGATRAVVVTRNYYSADPPRLPGHGRVAKYARGRDYHTGLAGPLNALAAYTRTLGPPGAIALASIDAGPVPERELAQRAGLGWIGKNTMLIDPRRGSFFFIGSILTSVDLALDLPFDADRCGSCRRCLEACPTSAFPDERVLDSRKCIAYLTIEHRGEIDPALAPAMGDWLFGCDICQDVCPWNVRFAAQASDPALEQNTSLAQLPVGDIEMATDEDLDARFGWTALERARPQGLRRNARIVQRNASSGASPAAR
jgi:epoxyqueuosine reductase